MRIDDDTGEIQINIFTCLMQNHIICVVLKSFQTQGSNVQQNVKS